MNVVGCATAITGMVMLEWLLWSYLNVKRERNEKCDHPEWNYDAILYALLVLCIIQLLSWPFEVYHSVQWVSGGESVLSVSGMGEASVRWSALHVAECSNVDVDKQPTRHVVYVYVALRGLTSAGPDFLCRRQAKAATCQD